MKLNITNLAIKWTVSRGQDTYGYNICSLWTNGTKVASCMGGGYDMQGTSLGIYLECAYQPELQAWVTAHSSELVPAYGDVMKHPDYYGMTIHPSGKAGISVSLDGGCGYEAMRRVAEDILGLDHSYSVNKRGNMTNIFLSSVGGDV
jgi:hypothetical protein